MFIAMLESSHIDTAALTPLLESAGHHVARLAHAPALARHLELGPCDVLVLSQSAWMAQRRLYPMHMGDLHRIRILAVMDNDSNDAQVAALESGVDACLACPLDTRVLLATVASLHRRLQDVRAPGRGPTPSPASQRDAWQLLSHNWVLVTPHGKRVQLTATECALLSLLLAHAGKPVSRREIVTALGHDYRHYDERRLEALVSRLRRKLSEDCSTAPIRVAHGFGYAFTASGLVS
jgi:DNA-binding response OmpR family regulator